MNEYEIDYGGLKPGLYLQRGGFIKKLDIATGGDDSWLAMLGLNRRVSTSTLADRESWTFTALSKRAETLISVPHEWVRGETDQEEAPFELNMRQLLPQIDKALQINEHGAFLYKWRVWGRKVKKLVWLNPTTITPDIESATLETGVTRYERKRDDGKSEWLKAEDVIWFKRPGQKEMQSDPAPLEASRQSAEILFNIGEMEDAFFETNGLPVLLIMVPATTSEAERNLLEAAFDKLYNRMGSPRTVKTKAVREGVDVKILSFSPNQMDLGITRQEHRLAVLAVHNVPQSVAMSNSANYATAMSDSIQFANTMASRLEAIAETLNDDPDIGSSGYMLDVRRNELPVLQQEETERAQAFSLLVGAGLHPKVVMVILGYDVPENYEGELFVDAPEPEPVPAQFVEPEMAEEPVKSAMRISEEQAFRRWIKNRGIGTDVAGFRSNELSYVDKLDIYAEFVEAQETTYP